MRSSSWRFSARRDIFAALSSLFAGENVRSFPGLERAEQGGAGSMLAENLLIGSVQALAASPSESGRERRRTIHAPLLFIALYP